MTILAWPSVLIPSSETWRIVGASASGGPSPLGNDQTIVSPAARWSASLTIPCWRNAQILAMRSLLAAFEGRANTVAVGPFDGPRVPWRIDLQTGNPITPSVSMAGNDDEDVALNFTLNSGIVLNDSSATLLRTRGGAIIPGMYLSVGSYELKMITSLTGSDAGAEGATVGVSFRPWIRNVAGYSSGATVELRNPLANMQLASDDTGQLQIDLARTGTVTLDLIEAL